MTSTRRPPRSSATRPPARRASSTRTPARAGGTARSARSTSTARSAPARRSSAPTRTARPSRPSRPSGPARSAGGARRPAAPRRPAAGNRPPARRPAPRHAAPPPVDHARRIGWLLVAIVAVAVVFVGVLVDLQALRRDRLTSVGQTQRTGTVELAAYRGSVTDRNGFVLAASTPARSIVADPTMIEDPAATATLLGPIVGVEVPELTELLTGEGENDRYALLARHLTLDSADRIDALRSDDDTRDAMVGIFLESDQNRVYPANELARPLVGQVDPDSQGIFGMEAQFDDRMVGIPGEEILERGVFGSISVGERAVTPAIDGSDVVLTIDHRLQFVAEQELLEHCEATGAAGATAVVADPSSGDILAMATVVAADDGTCRIPDHNAALVSEFEPGSVLKPITWAAAIEELGYHGSTLVDVPAEIEIGDETFEDPDPWVPAPYPLSQIAAESSNVGTIMIAQELGNETLYDYLSDFGLGERTGLDWEYEVRGRLSEPSEWYGSDAGSIPIGQGITVNATQLVGVYNAIGNGGVHVSPSLVREVVRADGSVEVPSVQSSHRVMEESTADELTELLVGVVDGGTGTNAAIPGYTVAGKTGTAWKVYETDEGFTYGDELSRRYVLTFAGFVPAEDPALSIVVVLDEPSVQGAAGALAAPAFQAIGEYGLRILGVPTENAIAVDTPVRGTPAPAPDDAPAEDGSADGDAAAEGDDGSADTDTADGGESAAESTDTTGEVEG